MNIILQHLFTPSIDMQEAKQIAQNLKIEVRDRRSVEDVIKRLRGNVARKKGKILII